MAWYVLPAGFSLVGLVAVLVAWLIERRCRQHYVSGAWIAHRYRRHGDVGGRFWKGDDE